MEKKKEIWLLFVSGATCYWDTAENKCFGGISGINISKNFTLMSHFGLLVMTLSIFKNQPKPWPTITLQLNNNGFWKPTLALLCSPSQTHRKHKHRECRIIWGRSVLMDPYLIITSQLLADWCWLFSSWHYSCLLLFRRLTRSSKHTLTPKLL